MVSAFYHCTKCYHRQNTSSLYTRRFTFYIYNNVEKNDRNTIEEQVYYQELKERHEMIVHALPARRRRIYELSFNKELSCPAIAGIMSLSSRTVEGQLLVARKTVRACLRNELNKVG